MDKDRQPQTTGAILLQMVKEDPDPAQITMGDILKTTRDGLPQMIMVARQESMAEACHLEVILHEDHHRSKDEALRKTRGMKNLSKMAMMMGDTIIMVTTGRTTGAMQMAAIFDLQTEV